MECNNLKKKSENKKKEESNAVVLDFSDFSEEPVFKTSIQVAIDEANERIKENEFLCKETIESIARITPDCDKIDYSLAASIGALCGVLDIFLVGKPGESLVGTVTDKWIGDRTLDFACKMGWKNDGNLSSAIRFLEKKFKIPYDQQGGDAASAIFGINTRNHHFKSLAHNPSILGLFFSVLDQFSNTSHFVTEGRLVSLQNADGSFSLMGKDIPSKFFCAVFNWIGHLISDNSGSSSSKGRGMGIPSPLWTWINDMVAVKASLHIPASDFDKQINDLAIEIYDKGFDIRFQLAQGILVFINEITVRVVYAVRRAIKYFSSKDELNRSFKDLWNNCEPFSNVSVKRMLTVAHGTFCLVDIADATIRSFATGGGYFNVVEFFLRLNISGLGRFGVSLFGEANRGINRINLSDEKSYLEKQKTILQDYIQELNYLAAKYNDQLMRKFVEELYNNDSYKIAFEDSARIAQLREVPEKKVLKSKKEIDEYFRGLKNEE